MDKADRGHANETVASGQPVAGASRRDILIAGLAGVAVPGLAGLAVPLVAPLASLPAKAAPTVPPAMNHAPAGAGAPRSAGPSFEADLGAGSPLRIPFTPGERLREPEVRRSVDGVLATTLRAAYGYRDIGGYRLYLRGYEGQMPGPTLRVQPGDVLRLTLINDLPPNREQMPAFMNQPHMLNLTNFHFHGGHVSPAGVSDNVLRTMVPGSRYEVEIRIPQDHPRGTYWYHPHHHGSADVQLSSGMVGVLIIEDGPEQVPEVVAAKDVTMVLGEVVFDGFGMVEGFEALFSETSVRFLSLNGQRAPTITMRPGEVQRWRLVHAGYQDDLFLHLAGHRMEAIARDGIGLVLMGEGQVCTDQPERTDAVLIAPGQRIDVLVKAGAPGSYALQALPYNQGYPSPFGPIATLMVEGEPLDMALPGRLAPPPLPTIRDEEITNRRELVFSAVVPEAEAAAHWREFTFLIDGKVFDINRVDHAITLGAVEEWTLVNAHFHDHIFHIHVNPFELIKVNGDPIPPVWLDTVVLPRNGSLTFRSRFTDFPGRYVLHCHMMNHEEMGMMQLIEVS
ncbi:multicopper oxidase domain-containing protein [Ancylobacter sp. A5.8]|uniref:multicopper oxidase family protein n=1 Tax=Ancylobacter gelatini TaxID=2919920 RepID=UPI001F4E750A|nr:multicopper oxidase domain-containing protein [Ancylobacter gelatini]MCJ8143434.1 multicopper oxidase domain-containing protein [Ancylobacter gelatini]